jgi:HD-like signal output (HDOD) protein
VVALGEQRAGSGLPAGNALRDKALRSLSALPPFSPILNRLLASLAAEDVSFSKLGDLIEKDTVIAANLLHVVNSALYARRGTINSVRHALSLLGMNKLRNAVLGMSVSRMWNQVVTPASWSMARFNLHSAAAAMLSDLLAQRVPVYYPEGAFVAGLLHDIGQLLIAVGLTEQHDQILQLHEGGVPLLECEQRVLGFTHPELSAQALALWNLPEPIQTAVRDHHASPSRSETGDLPLSRVIQAADQYVNSTGISILLSRSTQGPDEAAALPSLGLEPKRIESVIQEFNTEFASMSPFFS